MSAPVTVLPVGSSITFGTGISTYSGLVTSVGTWLSRGDLAALVPDFILLVEERFNRLIRAPEMEQTADLVTVAGVDHIAQPDDMLEVRSIYLATDPLQPLEQVTPHQLRHLWAASATGKPLTYAIVGDQIRFGPTPDADYAVVVDYYECIPALDLNHETNWVIARHPSYYLYGSLLQAELYGWNDERLPLIKSAWDDVFEELHQQNTRKRYGSGPLRMRSGVSGQQ